MIKATDSVEELVEKYPELVGFLLDRGIVCVKCGEPFWGPLGDLISNKGKDIEAVLAEINAEIATKD